MSTYRNSKADHQRRGRRSRAIGLGIAGALLGIGIIATVSATSAQAGPAHSWLPADKAALQQAADDSARNKTGHVPSKADAKAQGQAVLHQATADKAAAGGNPAAPGGPFAGLTAGIVDQRQGPFPASLFASNNMYRAQVGARWLFAFAGAPRDENGQQLGGALRVYQLTADGNYSLVGVYPAPAGTGALRVSSGTGPVLTLASDSDRSLTFDLASLSYS
jgi:hypothetical protein